MPRIGPYRAKTDLGVLGLSHFKGNGYEYAEDQRSGSQDPRRWDDVRALHYDLCAMLISCKNFSKSSAEFSFLPMFTARAVMTVFSGE